ncbi:JmjC domain, hydroxylase-domain-containing protein [Sporodiniella umbellata]|nr:JmjC domain, hydroxylase-domain-containing protein [Sporodiniella umbellata]
MKLQIEPSCYYDQENGGTIPIFTPTMKEFEDFNLFVESIDKYGKVAGLVKIIPPKEWKGQLPDINSKINEIKIKRPITQQIGGSQGVFNQKNIEKRTSYTVEQWYRLCQKSDHRPPKMDDGKTEKKESLSEALQEKATTTDLSIEQYKTIEKTYWRSLTFNDPMYGADMLGTLFDDSVKNWNMNHLDNILNDIGTIVPGVNVPYLYFGMWKATFPWHVEDMNLYSINYIHFGAPKQWYAIPPEHREKFERVMRDMFYLQYKECHEFLRHKTYIISPRVLEENHIPVSRCVQQPGELMITFPYGYHSGYNLDFNCAESVNFALKSWIPIGRTANPCTCFHDTVMIDVNALCKDQPRQISKCMLCPFDQFSALPNDDYYLYPVDKNRGVHKLCAESVSETFIENSIVKGIEKIKKTKWKLICIYCKKSSGRCIQCSYSGCLRPFHATCALEMGIAFYAKKKAENGSLYDAYCLSHVPEKIKLEEDHQNYLKEMKGKLRPNIEIYAKVKGGIQKCKVQKCMVKGKACKVLLQNGHSQKVFWKNIQFSPSVQSEGP